MTAKPKPRKVKARLRVTVPPPIFAKAHRMAKKLGVSVSRLVELLVIEELGHSGAGLPTDLCSPEIERQMKRMGAISTPRKKAARKPSRKRV